MRNIIFFLFPKIKREIDKANSRYFNLSKSLKKKDEYIRSMTQEGRLMADHILTLENRLNKYENTQKI